MRRATNQPYSSRNRFPPNYENYIYKQKYYELLHYITALKKEIEELRRRCRDHDHDHDHGQNHGNDGQNHANTLRTTKELAQNNIQIACINPDSLQNPALFHISRYKSPESSDGEQTPSTQK